MKLEQTTLPSRKEIHHRSKSDYSQWFRLVLLVSFTVMIAGFMYWGYAQSARIAQEGELSPGVETDEHSEPTSFLSAQTPSKTIETGLPPLDLSDSGEDTSDAKTEAEAALSTEPHPSDNNQNSTAITTDPVVENVTFSGKYHVVQNGETLYSIAMKHFSDKSYVNKIAQLNGLKDETKIYAGYKLKIPNKTP
jgi:LysM repeat protein